MRWLGCVSAINFDGGGSSALWVKGEGIVNYPTDNRKWDHEGERKVANILYVK
jgi:exopolysaccharide biosynthesis protein